MPDEKQELVDVLDFAIEDLDVKTQELVLNLLHDPCPTCHADEGYGTDPQGRTVCLACKRIVYKF